jgi:hypothetical protein
VLISQRRKSRMILLLELIWERLEHLLQEEIVEDMEDMDEIDLDQEIEEDIVDLVIALVTGTEIIVAEDVTPETEVMVILWNLTFSCSHYLLFSSDNYRR